MSARVNVASNYQVSFLPITIDPDKFSQYLTELQCNCEYEDIVQYHDNDWQPYCYELCKYSVSAAASDPELPEHLRVLAQQLLAVCDQSNDFIRVEIY